MLSNALRRFLAAVLAVVGASIVSFILLRAVPTNPARLIAGPLASDEVVQQQVERMGLDRPLPEQYVRYIVDFVRGDWGFAYSAGAPVRDVIAQRLPASVELALAAFALATLFGVSFGILATFLRGRWDGAVRLSAFLAMGIPPFWIALIGLMVFFEGLGWAPPPGGRLGNVPVPDPVTGLLVVDALIQGEWLALKSAIGQLLLPAASLALAPYGYLVRLLRANVLDNVRAQYAQVALSKGITRWRAHWRHVVPNAFLPTLTASGLTLAQLIGGSVLVEKVFNWPGVGTLVVDAILRQDYGVVQAFILLSAVTYVFVNYIVDVLYGVLDPRLKA